jgi:hypothetical protein
MHAGRACPTLAVGSVAAGSRVGGYSTPARRARHCGDMLSPQAEPTIHCDHLHDTTSRYDHAEKKLTFLLVCHACETEKVIVTLPYEPRFEQIEQHPVRLAA